MELILFIASGLFWIVFYIFQGIHDTHFIKEVTELQNAIDEKTLIGLQDSIIQRELKWKLYGSIEKALTKIFMAVLIYFITQDVTFSILIFLLSILLRWFVHDITVAIGLGRGINHIGPDFIWTDKILRNLSRKGINQYLIKLLPLIILIAAIILYIID